MTTLDTLHQQAVARQGAEDAGQYFRYMAEYVGFTSADADAIRQTKPIIEKHLPEIVSKFYAHLLRYPPTRKFFLNTDGSLNQDYLELRMRHLTNFWLRTAEGVFDDEYARYVDYVGRAHTSRGADPNIYIAERYVIGQVGMMQHAISEAINRELSSEGSMVEFPAGEAWDKLMMVVLELLARAYGEEREPESFDALIPVDTDWIGGLAKGAVAKEQWRCAACTDQGRGCRRCQRNSRWATQDRPSERTVDRRVSPRWSVVRRTQQLHPSRRTGGHREAGRRHPHMSMARVPVQLAHRTVRGGP